MNCGVITDWPAKIAGLVPVSPLMYLAARSAGGSDQLHAATGQLQTMPACSCGQLARLISAGERGVRKSIRQDRKEGGPVDVLMFRTLLASCLVVLATSGLFSLFVFSRLAVPCFLDWFVHRLLVLFSSYGASSFFCVCVDTVCLDLLKLETGDRTFWTF